LVPIGLIDSIYDAAAFIDFGRKGFAIRGKEREGRISYEDGIDKAMLTRAAPLLPYLSKKLTVFLAF
jgi:hypothetical protein